jgi:tRNA dimethylallyltransferase
MGLRDDNFRVCLYIMKKKLSRPFILILYGPTGVGKTEVALSIAQEIPSEIINMDMGQFYTPLSIGTAKPDWKNSPTPHHLFDIIDTPINFTIAQYREMLYKTVQEVIARGNLPILVGGSGFYLHSLLFPPQTEIPDVDIAPLYSKDANLWQELYAIDPQRAMSIDKADAYRIRRALGIWHATGKLPSSYAPEYNPSVDYLLIFLERDRQELKKRIDDRVVEMFNAGWLAEGESLIGTPWQQFIEKKNLIGYSEIFDYVSHGKDKKAYNSMLDLIRIKTRQYAKRQFTFWRKLEREIKQKSGYTGNHVGCLETVSLTNLNISLYISELLKRLPFYEVKKNE